MNSDAKAFSKLLELGRDPLWHDCTKHTKLSAVAILLNIKADHNIIHECFESLLKAIKNPRYALEPRNVRLGLSIDGFNPFGHSAVPYSCWPVIVTSNNLPHWMCMKQPYMFLSFMIPGPTSPGKNLDVYLDASYCMEHTKSFTLQKGQKPCRFDYHRRFFPEDHPFRRKRENFRKGKVENDRPIPRLSGTEMRARVTRLPIVLFGKNDKKISDFGESHNWVRTSIF
ncbi:hypothetical protein AgCh_034267 [Apium graveolens]